MKAKYKIVALGLCLGLITCSDFLDLQPKNKLGGEQFYQTAEQFTMAVNGAYSTLQEGGQYGNWYVFSEIPSDNTHNLLSGSVVDQDEFDKFYTVLRILILPISGIRAMLVLIVLIRF